MKKIRMFERKCVRACVNMNRSAETEYTKYISNQKLYDKANIPRIDNFIINLIRDHFFLTNFFFCFRYGRSCYAASLYFIYYKKLLCIYYTQKKIICI